MNKVMSNQERYLNDPVFHSLVDTINYHLSEGNFTPTEAREAVHLACLHFEQVNITPYFMQKRNIK